jgi:hypothetical protein
MVMYSLVLYCINQKFEVDSFETSFYTIPKVNSNFCFYVPSKSMFVFDIHCLKHSLSHDEESHAPPISLLVVHRNNVFCSLLSLLMS